MPANHQPVLPITYRMSQPVSNDDLNHLFVTAWPDHHATDFEPILRRSLTYVCAYAQTTLVGFVNVAWDGGIHAFLLDTTVHVEWQRQGIGRQLVHHAIATARAHGIHWLHVDYEAHLDTFYRSCGFEPTLAGLIRLNE